MDWSAVRTTSSRASREKEGAATARTAFAVGYGYFVIRNRLRPTAKLGTEERLRTIARLWRSKADFPRRGFGSCRYSGSDGDPDLAANLRLP